MSATASSPGRRRADSAGRHTIDEILASAREGAEQVGPAQLPDLLTDGAHVIDIRPAADREAEGHLPGATVMERLVLEWRLDPHSPDRMSDGPGYDDLVVVVCNEGYYSSLAARDLRDLGFHRATDLRGGFRAHREAGLPVDDEPTRRID